MTLRALLIELRRSTAPWSCLIMLGAGGPLLYMLSINWTARWGGLAFALRTLLVALWPLAFGVGAWQAGRERRARVDELFTSTARPGWHRVLVVGFATALGVAAGYLLLFAAGLVQVAPTATYVGTAWAATLGAGTLALVAATWVGMAFGRLFPSMLAPPVAVGAGFAISSGSMAASSVLLDRPVNGGPSLLGTLGAVVSVMIEEPYDFSALTGRFVLAQLVWFAGMAATGLALVIARRRAARVVAVLPAALALAVAVPVAGGAASERYVLDEGAASLVCTPDAPRVCVTKVHAAALPGVVGPAREVLARLSVLPDAPVEAVEDRSAAWWGAGLWRRADRTLWEPSRLTFDLAGALDRNGRVTRDASLTERLAAGAATRLCPDVMFDEQREWTARAVATAWLMETPLPAPAAGELDDRWALAALRSLPEAEQRDRVAAYRAASFTCDGDPLELLVPGKVPTVPAGR
jgi:hypothetical protein